jgi:uncharacterized protein
MTALAPRLALPLAEIAALCRRYRVRELALFGSALRDDFGPDSDLDFLVEFEPGAEIGFMALAGLQFDLADLLGRDIDVVPKRGLKPRVRADVLSATWPVYAAE